MMGYTHALSGMAAWLGAVPFMTDEDLLGSFAVALTPQQVAAGAVICAGTALLPDIDHHDGTIANTYGPISQLFCKVVGKVSGGHRHATHSLVFAAAAGIATEWMAEHAVYVWWVLLFLVVSLGLRAIGIGFHKSDYLTGVLNTLLAAGIVYLMRDLDMRFVGHAVTLGCLAHVVGDCLTPRGCPVFWPLQWSVEMPVIAHTNGKAERWVVAPALTFAIVIFTVRTVLGNEIVAWLTA